MMFLASRSCLVVSCVTTTPPGPDAAGPRAAPAAAPRVAARRAGDEHPLDPARPVPPARARPAVGTEGEDVDAVGAARRCRGLAGEGRSERLPVMPVRTVPVAIPQLAIVVDGEELALSAIAPRRHAPARDERAAKPDP